MSTSQDLHIAEIPHTSGSMRYRYSRYLSPDGTRWVRHGLFVEYHENGKRAGEGSYSHGSEEGLWQYFHPNGQLAAEGHYVEGKEEGAWRYWKTTGEPEPSVAYKLGEEVR